DAAQRLIASDPALRGELDVAAALDGELSVWAMAPLHASDVEATAAADAALARLPAPRRWLPAAMLGGTIAASLLAAVIMLPSLSDEVPSSAAPQIAAAPTASPVQTAQVAQDVQLWGAVFTLTPEEESLI
ncbi:MAG: hypothetical protein Q7J32_11100, partial [Sphingomonadaceae bacterium]|nr:hypothetical protein [Sphingomonadaceae bacterium]